MNRLSYHLQTLISLYIHLHKSKSSHSVVKVGVGGCMEGRPPGRSSEQAKVLPTKLESAIVLHQSVPIRRKHPKQQCGLCCCISSQRYPSEPTLLKLLSPVVELHLSAPRRPSDRQHVPDLSREQLLLHHVPLLALLPVARSERVEQGGVVVYGLNKPPQEGARVAQVLSHHRHYFWCQSESTSPNTLNNQNPISIQ